jgi:hypothetical protein
MTDINQIAKDQPVLVAILALAAIVFGPPLVSQWVSGTANTIEVLKTEQAKMQGQIELMAMRIGIVAEGQDDILAELRSRTASRFTKEEHDTYTDAQRERDSMQNDRLLDYERRLRDLEGRP